MTFIILLKLHVLEKSFTLFLLYINNLPDNVIRNIAIYADDTTRYSRCDHASDLW